MGVSKPDFAVPLAEREVQNEEKFPLLGNTLRCGAPCRRVNKTVVIERKIEILVSNQIMPV